MKKTACQYAIVRFAPFIETEEFANIGVVLFCPKTGVFQYRLQLKKHARITHFFEPLKADIFRASMVNLRAELDRIQKFANVDSKYQLRLDLGETEMSQRFFNQLTRSREGTVRFSDTRVVLAISPSETIDELFKFYVDRNFVNAEYGESLLEKEMRGLLNKHQLDKEFAKAELDDGIYRKTFPFVKMENEKVVKVIKPFFLGQKRPTQIIDHGVTWIQAVKRFQSARKLPREIMFAVKGPKNSGPRSKAYDEIVNEMSYEGFLVVPTRNTDKILRYASG